MLWRMGFTSKQVEKLIRHYGEQVKAFRSALNYFENIKISKGEREVADGVDHPPVFLIRHILRELPVFLLRDYKNNNNGDWSKMPAEEFCKIMAGSYINKKDLCLTENREQKALQFQQLYRNLICVAGRNKRKILRSIVERSSVINYERRSTGDGLIGVIEEAIKISNQADRNQFQKILWRFIESQVLVPGKWKAIKPSEMKGSSLKARSLRRIQKNVELYHELI